MRRRAWAIVLPLLLAACGAGRRYDQAVCVLIDISGTYADQKPEVVRIIKRELLPAMVPGDSLMVIRVDSESYRKENVEAILTLDRRPSRANAQKLALAGALDDFAASELNSPYTDLPGAMMLGSEYLRELGSASQVLLVFSDMQEDLPKGTPRTLREREFEGIRVAAMNVKRLKHDTFDPERFRERMATWESRVTRAGALEWRTFADASKLPAYLEAIR